MNHEEQVKQVLKNNPQAINRGRMVDAPSSGGRYEGDRLPAYVKCKVCGKPPIGADWLKPVSSDPNCKEFVHLSHIPNGPILSHAVDRVRSV